MINLCFNKFVLVSPLTKKLNVIEVRTNNKTLKELILAFVKQTSKQNQTTNLLVKVIGYKDNRLLQH